MIIGTGGVATKVQTKLVQVDVIDTNGDTSLIECVVLQKTCGNVLPLDKKMVKKCKTVYKVDMSKLVTRGGRVDLLVGMSAPMLHQQKQI